jgi:hypothetical protein
MAQYSPQHGMSAKRYVRAFANLQGEQEGNVYTRCNERIKHLYLQTSDDLKEVLAKKQQQIDVKELLKSLHLTIEFENQLSKRFSQQSKNDDTHRLPFKFEKSISSVFEPYLGLYIEAEDGYVPNI